VAASAVAVSCGDAMRLVVAAAVLLLDACARKGASGSSSTPRTESVAKQRGETIGLWRVPPHQGSHEVSSGVIEIVGWNPFYFDGESIVIRLITLDGMGKMWRSPDDIYRLRARWQGADLQCLLPFFGSWETVATFRDGRFEQKVDGGPFVFERISERDLGDEDRLLLKAREKHDYRRQTDGSLAGAPGTM
jgi:hypothetical protein